MNENCRKVREHLGEIYGNHSGDEAKSKDLADFRAHIEGCLECQVEAELWQEVLSQAGSDTIPSRSNDRMTMTEDQKQGFATRLLEAIGVSNLRQMMSRWAIHQSDCPPLNAALTIRGAFAAGGAEVDDDSNLTQTATSDGRFNVELVATSAAFDLYISTQEPELKDQTIRLFVRPERGDPIERILQLSDGEAVCQVGAGEVPPGTWHIAVATVDLK